MDTIILPSRSHAGGSDEFIKPSRSSAADELDITEAKKPLDEIDTDQNPNITSPEDVYKALGSEPNIEAVLKVLKWLEATEDQFRWKIPSPKAARVTNLLVNIILPDHWPHMQDAEATAYKKARKLFLRFLTSLTGIGNLVTRLQSLSMHRKNELQQQQQQDATAKIKTSTTEEVRLFQDVIAVLQSILAKEGVLTKLWDEFEASDVKPLQRGLLCKEVVNLLAGSRVLSVSAEAFAIIDELSPDVGSRGWVGDGQQYTSWLASNIKGMVLAKDQILKERQLQVTALFKRAMSLGYVDQLTKGVFWDTAFFDAEGISTLRVFLDTLDFGMQRVILYNLIRIMSQDSAVKSHTDDTPKTSSKGISAIAAFLLAFIYGQEHLRAFLADWMTDRSGGGTEVDSHSRRAVIAVLAQYKGRSIFVDSAPL